MSNIEITSNKELSDTIERLIKESGYKKTYIADQLGIANQNLSKRINKHNISLDDANAILNVINCTAIISISNKLKK